jgi:hypothetical protein
MHDSCPFADLGSNDIDPFSGSTPEQARAAWRFVARRGFRITN